MLNASFKSSLLMYPFLYNVIVNLLFDQTLKMHGRGNSQLPPYLHRTPWWGQWIRQTTSLIYHWEKFQLVQGLAPLLHQVGHPQTCWLTADWLAKRYYRNWSFPLSAFIETVLLVLLLSVLTLMATWAAYTLECRFAKITACFWLDDQKPLW